MQEVHSRSDHKSLTSSLHAHRELRNTTAGGAKEQCKKVENNDLITNRIIRKAHKIAIGSETWLRGVDKWRYMYVIWHLAVACHSLGGRKNR